MGGLYGSVRVDKIKITIMGIFALVILVVFIIAGIVWLNNTDLCDTYNLGSGIISVISGIILLGCVIAIPINRWWNLDNIKAYEAFQETLDSQRENATEYENAVITQKIIEWNAELAKWKNQNVWYRCDLWIHDDIEKLMPIK